MAGAGGTVIVRENPDAATGAVDPRRVLWNRQLQCQSRRVQFQRSDHHTDHQRLQRQSVLRLPRHERPQWADERSARVNGRIGQWHLDESAAQASGDPSMQKVAYNCGPAISRDGSKVYVASIMPTASRTVLPVTW